MNENSNEVNQRVSWLENMAFYVMLGVMFLLPLIFIPAVTAPFQFTKTAFLLLGILIAFFLYVISRLEDGKIIVPFNRIIVAAWLLPLAYFVSSLSAVSTLSGGD